MKCPVMDVGCFTTAESCDMDAKQKAATTACAVHTACSACIADESGLCGFIDGYCFMSAGYWADPSALVNAGGACPSDAPTDAPPTDAEACAAIGFKNMCKNSPSCAWVGTTKTGKCGLTVAATDAPTDGPTDAPPTVCEAITDSTVCMKQLSPLGLRGACTFHVAQVDDCSSRKNAYKCNLKFKEDPNNAMNYCKYDAENKACVIKVEDSDRCMDTAQFQDQEPPVH